MLKEHDGLFFHFFKDEDGRYQGEFKERHFNKSTATRCFYVDGKKHGEFKAWYTTGKLYKHCFCVNDKEVSFNEIPRPLCPATEEDRIYYLLKYDMNLLSVEQTC